MLFDKHGENILSILTHAPHKYGTIGFQQVFICNYNLCNAKIQVVCICKGRQGVQGFVV